MLTSFKHDILVLLTTEDKGLSKKDIFTKIGLPLVRKMCLASSSRENFFQLCFVFWA